MRSALLVAVAAACGGDDTMTPDSGVDAAYLDAATLTCPDDSYDVDGDPANGCEVVDALSIHSAATAHDFGDVSECDTASLPTLASSFPSDARIHLPSNVSGELGRADFIKAKSIASSACTSDPAFALTFTGGVGTYKITVHRGDDAVDTACSPLMVGGAGTITGTCTAQDANEVISLLIEKVSGPPEAPAYTLTYHN